LKTKNTRINARVLDDFVVRLNSSLATRIDTPGGWITEPVTVRSDDEWLPRELSVQIAKLVTNTRDPPVERSGSG
jgi:hypothetical protein